MSEEGRKELVLPGLGWDEVTSHVVQGPPCPSLPHAAHPCPALCPGQAVPWVGGSGSTASSVGHRAVGWDPWQGRPGS